MICIYISIAFFIIGMGLWIAGSVVDKQKKKQPKSKRKKYQRRSEKLSMIARIVFVLCALSFVLGFIMLQGSRM